jgi:peptidoglycan/xylan/chitin deacetylase (PgdA/CDA1 family)
MAPANSLFPYHHIVSNESLPHIKHLYNYKNEAQFIKDLDFLLKHYTPVSAAEVIRSIKNKIKLAPHSFLLSFDDGFREVHDIIAPILEKKGVPAIFFINPSFIDNKELFYRCKISLLINELIKNKDNINYLKIFYECIKPKVKSFQNIISSLKLINQTTAGVLDSIAQNIEFSFEHFLQKEQPFLNSNQLLSLQQRGFSIGAHSMNHPYYNLLSLNEQIEQTIRSCKFVNELLGTKDCCFSFPHSDKELTQELFTKLYKTDIPILFGIQNQKIELSNNILHRFNAERPETNLETQIKGLTLMMWLLQLAGRNKVKRQ